MTWKSLSNAICLECLALVATILLAASNVEGKGEDKSKTPESGGNSKPTFGGCYNSKNQHVKCSKKNGIIVGAIIGAICLFLGALYLYGMWTERRKKWRKGTSNSTPEENQPLGDGPRTDSDCEKGAVTAAGKNENGVDYKIQLSQHTDKSDGASVSGTSSIVSDLPSYDRPPGLTYNQGTF